MNETTPPPLFQNFDVKTDSRHVAPRLRALRAQLGEAGLDGFLIPRSDAHRGESVPPGEARLAYVTGFTGSAGLALVTTKQATLFVDGRYVLQAPAETDTKLVRVIEAAPGAAAAKVAAVVPKDAVIGYDPWLHTPAEIAEIEAKLKPGARLVPTHNLVDRIWPDRPGAPVTPIEFLGHNRAGQAAADKLADLRATLAGAGADATVLTLPESICWLFNMRGRDVPNTPFVLGFAIVPRTGRPRLFVDKAKINAQLRHGLEAVAAVADVRTMPAALHRLGAAGKRVMLDPATCPVAVYDAIRGGGDASIVDRPDPVLLPKARKNAVEIGGMREAHRLDAVAMAKFLHWFDGEAPNGRLTEIDIATALEGFRREEHSLVDLSFDTIAGAGPNGAIVHYRVNRATNRGLAAGELMLVDSGGQYLTGTTDVTRTLSTGKVTAEHKDRFTRVLRGMMAISMLRFPKGTSGAMIDIMARQFLWQDGITYHHGTGHGVGHYLSVHEGPAGISPRYATPLEPGMIVSNEPGYYKEGAYGIRTENLILVVESAIGDGGFLEFETLTLVPIDRRLIDETMLTQPERDWLNAYHARIRAEIGPRLTGAVRDWLEQATRPI
ncbi:aminopeptidase P family protein [Devosia sp.]|uniref:aminopeptidase P family protein n=1 Tax=Devosia sp. TaxID=1871048 RepID=UPI002F21CB6E